MRVLVLASLASLPPSLGCGGAAVFVCTQSSDCGAGGVCEPSGYCSFPDGSCPSMQRYGEHAPDTVAGACVEPAVGTSSGAVADDGGSNVAEPSSSGVASPGDSSDVGGDDDGSSTGAATSTGGPTVTSSDADGGSDGPGAPTIIGPVLIADDLDDGAIWLGDERTMPTWLPSGETPGHGFCGEFPSSQQYIAYLRFALPQAIPADATIDSAVLELYGHTIYNWDATHALRVWAEYTADAPRVEGFSAHPSAADGVPLGDASVRWADDDGGLTWLIPGPNASTDLAPLVQQLVDDHGGLVAGAHVQLWVTEDVLDGEGSEVGWYDSSSGVAVAPRLTVALR